LASGSQVLPASWAAAAAAASAADAASSASPAATAAANVSQMSYETNVPGLLGFSPPEPTWSSVSG